MKAEAAIQCSEKVVSRNIARFRITFELLAQMLLLPDGTKIQAVRVDPEYPFDLEIRAEHPELKPVGDCCAIPLINPSYRLSITYHPEFESWGQS